MGYIQDKIESDRKISEAFQALAGDCETHLAVLKAIEYQNRLKQKDIVESQCPLCHSCDSPKIRICKKHQILLTKN